MEMNTRLQVEHPVTEMTHGVDLVEWQLRIANGEPLPLTQEQVQSHGHAIEVRLYAEDPDHGFLPGSGKLTRLQLPAPSSQLRLDGGVIEGDTVTIFYDPMIAKMIVWDTDRPAALQRMREALAQTEIVGPKSNVAFLERLVRHPAIIEHRIDTGYLDRHLDEFIAGAAEADARTLFAATAAALLYDEQHVAGAAADPHSPWNTADAWRVGRAGKRVIAFALGEHRHEVEAWGHAGQYQLQCGSAACAVDGARWDGHILDARFAGEAMRFAVRADATRVVLHDPNGIRWRFQRVPAFAWEASDAAGGNQVTAPMPGRIVLVKAESGDQVEAGQELLVMEAMKMELSLKAPRAGVIDSLSAAAGDFVEADAVLVRFAE
jgi:3-methylcrotonyl-CoA carboxylase alpha subunit